MSSEKIPSSNPENSASLQSLLNSLGELFRKYRESTDESGKERIRVQQLAYADIVKTFAAETLQKAREDSLSDSERDNLMADYGLAMDQLAVYMPMDMQTDATNRLIQQEALDELLSFVQTHPRSPNAARYVFMLYHHGAGIDAALTKDAIDAYTSGAGIPQEFAKEYVAAERRGLPFLEKYIASVLGTEDFSLEKDYEKLLSLKVDDRTHAPLLDAANWFRRIAYFEKVTRDEESRMLHAERAVKLHVLLAPFDSHVQGHLNNLYEELGMTPPVH